MRFVCSCSRLGSEEGTTTTSRASCWLSVCVWLVEHAIDSGGNTVPAARPSELVRRLAVVTRQQQSKWVPWGDAVRQWQRAWGAMEPLLRMGLNTVATTASQQEWNGCHHGTKRGWT